MISNYHDPLEKSAGIEILISEANEYKNVDCMFRLFKMNTYVEFNGSKVAEIQEGKGNVTTT